jgi:hypothetical protein
MCGYCHSYVYASVSATPHNAVSLQIRTPGIIWNNQVFHVLQSIKIIKLHVELHSSGSVEVLYSFGNMSWDIVY